MPIAYGTAEYRDLQLLYPGTGYSNCECVWTLCGQAEFCDLKLPPGSIVGDEHSIDSGPCCYVPCSPDNTPYYVWSTACCETPLPDRFQVILSGDCATVNGTYDVFAWFFDTGYCAAYNPLWIGQVGTTGVRAGCADGVFRVNVQCEEIDCLQPVYISIPMTITSCCPFTATGTITSNENNCCSSGQSITATISTYEGLGGSGYTLYYRDIQIPQQYLRESKPFCIPNPTDCCPTPITSECCLNPLPSLIYLNVSFPDCPTIDGLAIPLNAHVIDSCGVIYTYDSSHDPCIGTLGVPVGSYLIKEFVASNGTVHRCYAVGPSIAICGACAGGIILTFKVNEYELSDPFDPDAHGPCATELTAGSTLIGTQLPYFGSAADGFACAIPLTVPFTEIHFEWGVVPGEVSECCNWIGDKTITINLSE